MLATLTISGVAAVLILLAGAAICILVHPTRDEFGAEVPAVGLAALIILASPVSRFFAAPAGTIVVIAVLIALAAVGLIRRHRAGAPVRRLPRISAPLRTTLILGAAATGLLLLPILASGFPTTISWSNWDAWWYAGMVDWLQDHHFSSTSVSITEPLSFIAAGSGSYFMPGLESVIASVAFLTHRFAYETIGPVLALGGLVAVSAWMALANSLNLKASRWIVGSAALIAALSPMLVMTSVQVYAHQYVSLSLWPLAIATGLQAMREPRVRTIALAGLCSGAIATVYPTMLIWLVPALLAGGLALVTIGERPDWVLRARAVVLGLLGLAAASIMFAPVQVATAFQSLTGLSGKWANPGFPPLNTRTLAAIGIGAWATPANAPATWAAIAVTTLLGATLAWAGWRTIRNGNEGRRLALIAVGAVIPSVMIAAAYTTTDPYPYGAYKAAINGGALVVGCLLLGIAHGSQARAKEGPARRNSGVMLLTVVAVVWIPVTLGLLEMQKSATGAGFRAPDVVLGRVLKGLPQESTTLVEGTVDSGDAFRTRMMAAYMGEVVAERAVIGLGTTGSYLTARDDPFFKPRTPWTYVLGYGRPVAATHRRPVWADPPYVLTAAPAIDITTWGHAWGATEVDGSTPFVWLSGPGEVLIANRSDRKRTVILQADLLSAGQRRLAVFRANGKIVSRNTVGTSRPVAAQARIVLKADSVTSVLVSAVPATLVRVGTDQRLLMMRVGNLRISPVTGSP